MLTFMDAQLTIRLPQNLLGLVKRAARQLQMKQADIVRMALRKFLSSAAPVASSSLFDQVADLVGCVDSGEVDLGSNHRKHLRTRMRRHGTRSA